MVGVTTVDPYPYQQSIHDRKRLEMRVSGLQGIPVYGWTVSAFQNVVGPYTAMDPCGHGRSKSRGVGLLDVRYRPG